MTRLTQVAAATVVTCAALVALPSVASAEAVPGAAVVRTINTSERPPDGVYFRYFVPGWDDPDLPNGYPDGFGVFRGEQVALACYTEGPPRGPSNNHIWYRVDNISRPTLDGPPGTVGGIPNSGYLSAHYVDDGQPADVPDPRVSIC